MIYSTLRRLLAVSAWMILAAIHMVLSPTNATAVQTTYFYTGNPFTSIIDPATPTGSYSMMDRITGRFTLVDAFPPIDRFLDEISPTHTFSHAGHPGPPNPALLSFSFSDGRTTLTDTTPGVIFSIEISLLAGAIRDWVISINMSEGVAVGDQGFLIETRGSVPGTVDPVTPHFARAFISEVLRSGGAADGAEVSGAPGTWVAVPVPEPSTMLLLGSGLAGLGWYRRRRKVA